MTERYCCDGMKEAVERDYLYQPITYSRDKKMTRLGTVIRGREQQDYKDFWINYCPFCGIKQTRAA